MFLFGWQCIGETIKEYTFLLARLARNSVCGIPMMTIVIRASCGGDTPRGSIKLEVAVLVGELLCQN